MTQSILILIEGIAGSGKSTVGQELAAILRANKISTEFFHEFNRTHPIRELNLENSSELIEKTASRWQTFVDEYQFPHVTIFDGVLSQCFIAELMLMCADEQIIIEGVRKVVKILEPLEPHIIFLDQNDVKESILKAYRERSERWQKKIDAFITNTEYGRRNKLGGLSGYIHFNQTYSALLSRIMTDADVACLRLETSQGEWSTYYGQITDFLSMKVR
jgi:thymidylate kinase